MIKSLELDLQTIPDIQSCAGPSEMRVHCKMSKKELYVRRAHYSSGVKAYTYTLMAGGNFKLQMTIVSKDHFGFINNIE